MVFSPVSTVGRGGNWTGEEEENVISTICCVLFLEKMLVNIVEIAMQYVYRTLSTFLSTF